MVDNSKNISDVTATEWLLNKVDLLEHYAECIEEYGKAEIAEFYCERLCPLYSLLDEELNDNNCNNIVKFVFATIINCIEAEPKVIDILENEDITSLKQVKQVIENGEYRLTELGKRIIFG